MQVNPSHQPIGRVGRDEPALKRQKHGHEDDDMTSGYDLDQVTTEAMAKALKAESNEGPDDAEAKSSHNGHDELNIDNELLLHGNDKKGQGLGSSKSQRPDNLKADGPSSDFTAVSSVDSYSALQQLRNSNTYAANMANAVASDYSALPQMNMMQKPAMGGPTDEYQKVRRNNHKEVERRRRENINEWITKIASVVPGCDKQKGEILKKTFAYITDLQGLQQTQSDTFQLEKVQQEQTIHDLQNFNARLKTELETAWKENAQLKEELEYERSQRKE